MINSTSHRVNGLRTTTDRPFWWRNSRIHVSNHSTKLKLCATLLLPNFQLHRQVIPVVTCPHAYRSTNRLNASSTDISPTCQVADTWSELAENDGQQAEWMTDFQLKIRIRRFDFTVGDLTCYRLACLNPATNRKYFTRFPLSWLQKIPGLYQDPRSIFRDPIVSQQSRTNRETQSQTAVTNHM